MRNSSRFSMTALSAAPLFAAIAFINACAGVEVTDPDAQVPTEPTVRAVSLSPRLDTLQEGAQIQLIASVTVNGQPDPSATLTWRTTDPDIATVNSTGVVRALHAGEVFVVAAVGSTSDRAALTIVPADVPVASVVMAPTSASVAVGQSITLAASPRSSTGVPLTGRTIVWSSTENVIATVSQSGLVQGQAPGTAVIRAESEGHVGTATVTVTPQPVATVTLSSASMSVPAGETRSITAVSRDASGGVLSGRTATWTSSNSSVATVASSGSSSANVTAVSAGTATITATVEGRTATAQVAVTSTAPVAVATVTVSPGSATVNVGATTALSATLRDASGNVLTGRGITWSSSANTVATVGSNGIVSGVAQGTATITATSEGRTGTASVSVTGGSTGGGGTGTVRFANEPVGMTRITDWTFPTLTGNGWSYMTWDSFARITQDATAPTDASVLEFVYPAGTVGGGAPARVAAPNLGSNRRELYWAFTWKANATWQGHSSGVNKLGFGWQGSRTFGLTWYWNVWGVNASPTISLFDAGITYFHPNTAAAVPIRAGQWHEVEVYYRPSSAAGVADGIVRIWVDGILMNDHVNVVTTSGAINDVYFEPTWGGIGDTKQNEDNHRFGQVRISVR